MLSQLDVDFDERDFFKEPFSEEELSDLVRLKPPSEVFSWRSPSFKAMGLEQEILSPEDLVRLMAQEPRLIRRPIVRVGDRLVIGANQKSIEAALQNG